LYFNTSKGRVTTNLHGDETCKRLTIYTLVIKGQYYLKLFHSHKGELIIHLLN